jgi:hypothetical protein
MSEIQTTTTTIDRNDLMILLRDLAGNCKEISVRLQLAGTLWTGHFSQVLVYSGQILLLSHLPSRTVTNIPDLDEITGFMVDKPYRSFISFNSYFIHAERDGTKCIDNGSFYA